MLCPLDIVVEALSMAYKSIRERFALGVFFSCYTEMLESEAFISTVVGVVMTCVDGLGGR